MSTDGSTLGYAELLRLAVSHGLQELDVTIIQIPTDQNEHHAIVLAGVRTNKGLFRAVGEARRVSLSEPLSAQTLTVAEVRAKTRALCEAVGMPQPLPASDATSSLADARNAVANPETRLREEKALSKRDVAKNTKATSPLSSSAAVVTEGSSSLTSEESTTPSLVPSSHPVSPNHLPKFAVLAEGLGPDILARLLQMTQKKAELEGNEISEEEAIRKLDSFFQRAFGHPLAQGTRVESQRVIQRLASELARLSEHTEESFAATP